MKTSVFNLVRIKEALKTFDPVQAIEEGFVAFSEGQVVVPPVGELILEKPAGEAHIKYGYVKGGGFFVIKVATGFYGNIALGLPTTSGLMLMFKQDTGELAAILLDEGYLTNVRTACAGAVAAKHLAPKDVSCIGVFGAGIQGRMQLRFLKPFTSCRKTMVWGINEDECRDYKKDMEAVGFHVDVCLEPDQIAAKCNLIVTATPSKEALISAGHIRPGTHITAMGSDTPEKNELDPQILANAGAVVADSLEQCRLRGEIFRALSAGAIKEGKAVELGNVISGKSPGRTSPEQVTVADLTGVAVQDINISEGVYRALTNC